MVARVKLVISGTLGIPAVETWSVGINYGPGARALPSTSTDLQSFANTAATTLAALSASSSPRSILSSAGTLGLVQAYYYPGPGPAAVAASAPISGNPAGAGSPGMPPQVARVVTLNTGQAGRRFRGRLYWPNLVGTLTNGLKLTTTTTSATDFAALLNSLETFDAVTGALQTSVYSAAAEAITPVISVSIGDVLDTQRRRRDGLQEIRSTATL